MCDIPLVDCSGNSQRKPAARDEVKARRRDQTPQVPPPVPTRNNQARHKSNRRKRQMQTITWMVRFTFFWPARSLPRPPYSEPRSACNFQQFSHYIEQRYVHTMVELVRHTFYYVECGDPEMGVVVVGGQEHCNTKYVKLLSV